MQYFPAHPITGSDSEIENVRNCIFTSWMDWISDLGGKNVVLADA